MFEHVSDCLSSVKAVIAAGVFLAASFVLMLTQTHLPVDPAWVTVLICGYPLVYWALRSLVCNKGINRITTMLLITVAMCGSVFIGEVFAAGEVAFIMGIGALLEEKTVERAKKGIKSLISLKPDTARKISGGKEETVPVSEVRKGDILRVLPGETVPADGCITAGSTSVDQSVMTGESLPVDKSAGDDVFCGTVNRFGAIDIKAVKVGEDSSLQKLIRLVENAENNKAPMQRIIDKWASVLVPVALLIAIAVYIITGDTHRAVTVLVVFCPCSLALATPTAIIAAIGSAAKNGVIIKSGEALERMGKTDYIAFDKTGTLTEGNLTVSDVVSFTRDFDVLALAASAESYSEHPLGKAVVLYAKGKNITLTEVSDFKMIPGKGISADVDSRRVLCGSTAYLEENGISVTKNMREAALRLRNEGKAVITVAAAGRCAGLVALSDTLRSAAELMIRELKDSNTDVGLFSGDHKSTAEYFAEKTGITQVYAELLPADKAEKINRLQLSGKRICMIGDGVNDAPALKTAYVGVAMGEFGSDIAAEAADIVLISGDLTRIPFLKRLSIAVIRTIKLNITLSMCINFIAITLAVLEVLTPVTGALWHNAGSVLVVLNAARGVTLRKKRN
ncbi:MAG: cation-translocating P-type ATPase [Oscillospiraceae bacterium]|jgi:heavy metal translocating P-type ATPase|nr:cation-translocating P-type ATPase [Oscillospiraceae bacterium]